VGKKCFNCKHFYEEKQHYFPQYIYTKKDSSQFTEEFEAFQAWIDRIKHQRVLCEGTVAAVLPDLKVKKTNLGDQFHLHGFLIRFNDGFIDNLCFSDAFYLSVSTLSQNKLAFRISDQVEFEANLTVDRGRFRFVKPGRFQFYQRGSEKPLSRADILVSLKTYSLQKGQPVKCLRCDYGILADIESAPWGPSRVLVCQQGVQDHISCVQQMLVNKDPDENNCVNPDWGKKNCHHVLS